MKARPYSRPTTAWLAQRGDAEKFTLEDVCRQALGLQGDLSRAVKTKIGRELALAGCHRLELRGQAPRHVYQKAAPDDGVAELMERLQPYLAERDGAEPLTLDDVCRQALGLRGDISRRVQTKVGRALSLVGCHRIERREQTPRHVYQTAARSGSLVDADATELAERIGQHLEHLDRAAEVTLASVTSGVFGDLVVDRSLSTRVGMALNLLGFERLERRNESPRFVYKRPQRNAASSQSNGNVEG